MGSNLKMVHARHICSADMCSEKPYSPGLNTGEQARAATLRILYPTIWYDRGRVMWNDWCLGDWSHVDYRQKDVLIQNVNSVDFDWSNYKLYLCRPSPMLNPDELP